MKILPQPPKYLGKALHYEPCEGSFPEVLSCLSLLVTDIHNYHPTGTSTHGLRHPCHMCHSLGHSGTPGQLFAINSVGPQSLPFIEINNPPHPPFLGDRSLRKRPLMNRRTGLTRRFLQLQTFPLHPQMKLSCHHYHPWLTILSSFTISSRGSWILYRSSLGKLKNSICCSTSCIHPPLPALLG